MNDLVQLILTILGLRSISKVTNQAVNVISLQIRNVVDNGLTVTRNLLDGKKVFKLSSGRSFHQDLEKWMKEINVENKQLDFKTALLELLENTESKVVKYGIKHGLDTLNSKIAVNLYKELEKHLAEYVMNEIMEIEQSLKGNSFFNLTDEIIPKELTDKLNLGKKYCPFFKVNIKQELSMFDQEISELFENYLKFEFGSVVSLSAKNLNKELRKVGRSFKIKQNSELKGMFNHFRVTYNMIRKQFKTCLQNKNSNMYLDSKKYEKSFQLDQDKIIIEADKNVGYVCMFTTDLIEQYSKINIQQHFGQVNITEAWYLENIKQFILDAQRSLPSELGKIILNQDFVWNKTTSEIGVLRLQPKVLKLKTVSYENIQNLTSRGIKSSMRDPIKIIQKVLDKIFSHLLYHIEERFQIQFGMLSPSVTGIKEAIERIKATKTGAWGKSIELEGDFSDLYSNCNEELLSECVQKACKYAKFHDSTFSYIKLLIKCIMSHSYFKEPKGIFKTLKGFSMGDCAAARGSEIILRIYELTMYNKLSRRNLF